MGDRSCKKVVNKVLVGNQKVVAWRKGHPKPRGDLPRDSQTLLPFADLLNRHHAELDAHGFGRKLARDVRSDAACRVVCVQALVFDAKQAVPPVQVYADEALCRELSGVSVQGDFVIQLR